MTTKSLSTSVAGKDYTTLAAWKSYLTGLGTLTADEIGEVYGELIDSTHVDLNGLPTGGGFSVILQAAAGEGVSAGGRAWWLTSGRATLRCTEGYSYGYLVSGTNIVIRDLQIEHTSPTGSYLMMLGFGALVDRCVLRKTGTSQQMVQGQSSPGTLRSTLVICNGFAAVRSVSRINCERVTAVNIGGASNGFQSDYGELKANGCIAYGFSNAFTGTAFAGSSHNATDLGSLGGTGFSTGGQTGLTSADFVSTGSGTEDYRPSTGSTKLKNLGVAISGLTLDLFGLTASQGSGPDIGAVEFTETVPAPTITSEPSAASVTAPTAATFSAAVSGTYTGVRWQRQAAGAGAWADVSGGTGGTTTSFTTGATSVSGGSFNSTDRFRLAVDWSGGVVYSVEVALTVGASGSAPSFSIQPSNQSGVVGGTATFSFRVTGSGSLTVQAKKNGTNEGSPFVAADGVTVSYTTPVLLIGDNGAVYTFEATGSTAPPATSSAATLTVQQPLATVFSFTLNGGNSLTGLKYAVFDQVTPDLWGAPIKQAANGSSNGSGVVTIDVTGLTTRRIGEKGSAILTNSDGTDTGGSQAATRKLAYYVGAFS